MKHHIVGFIFDLDGTLIDSSQDLAIAANVMRCAFHLAPLAHSTIMSYVGDGLPMLVKRLLPESSESQLKQGIEIFREYYAVHCTDYTKPYPGVMDTLHYFRHKSNTVVTNKMYSLSFEILQRLGLAHYFAAILGGDSTQRCKPDPMPINELVHRFGWNRAEVVMVGDSSNDMAAGKQAGVLTCAVKYGLRPVDELIAYHPDFMIDQFSDLCNLFE